MANWKQRRKGERRDWGNKNKNFKGIKKVLIQIKDDTKIRLKWKKGGLYYNIFWTNMPLKS